MVIAIAAVLALTAAGFARMAAGGNASCGRGVPAFKCQPGGPLAGPENNPQNVPAPAPEWPSPATIDCGQSFFDASTAAELQTRFGSLRCFRFDGTPRWVVVSDGMALSGDGPAPGGAMVAVESCTGAAGTCLDPNASHDFGDFTVSYDPDPTAWPARLETTFVGRVILIADGPCGLFTFNINSQQWHAGLAKDVAAQASGQSAPAVPAPAARSGRDALGASAPASSGGCSS
jgi:hypothetical protein